MGLKMVTDDKNVKIFRKDGTSKNGKPYSLYSIGVSSKNTDGTWNNAYVPCRFKKGTEEVFTKALIKIKNAFPYVNTYNDTTTVGWFITDFEVVEKGEEPQKAGSTGMAFMDIPDGIEQELPFE